MSNTAELTEAPAELRYVQYHSSKEKQYLSAIRQLISDDLSEPYSIYVYRYFLYQWGDLCFMVSAPGYYERASLCPFSLEVFNQYSFLNFFFFSKKFNACGRLWTRMKA